MTSPRISTWFYHGLVHPFRFLLKALTRRSNESILRMTAARRARDGRSPPSSDEEHEEDEEEAELPSGRIAELHDLKDSVPARFLNMVYEETALLRVEVEKEKRQLGRKGQSVTMAEKVVFVLVGE